MQQTKLGELTGLEAVPTAPAQPYPILFVHGWWGAAWVWDDYLPYFSRLGYHSYAVDLPGVPGSKPVPDLGKISFEDHLEAIRTVLTSLQPLPIVIGHSSGGLLLQKLAEEFPFPTVIGVAPAAPRGVFALASSELFGASFGIMPAVLTSRPFLPGKQQMTALNLNCLPPAEQDFVYRKMIPASGKQALQIALLGIPVDRSLIHSPLLVIAVKQDRLTPPKVSQAAARNLGAELKLFKQHAHYLMREPDWEQPAAEIASWLASRLSST